jgi:glutaminyl-peptide cyclotransferase
VKKRNKLRIRIRLNYLLPCVLILAACSRPTPLAPSGGKSFDGESALALLQEQMAFGDRTPGSEAHKSLGDYLVKKLEESGWSAEEQIFTYRGFEGRNIIGKAGPKDGGSVILGAHYDTRPISDRDDENPLEPVPGANDGGSGVAVLLELARVLQKEALTKQIWLVFFDLEDSGGIDGMDWIVGSTYFADHLEVLPDQVIIVDMIGDADLQIYYEANSDPELMGEVWGIASELGYKAFIPSVNHSLIDDHTPFLQRGIPAIDIIDFDYPFWHTTQDTLDKISSNSLEQVGRTLQQWLFLK